MKHIPVIILGAGGVGQALLQQIIDGRSRAAERNQINLTSWLWPIVAAWFGIHWV